MRISMDVSNRYFFMFRQEHEELKASIQIYLCRIVKNGQSIIIDCLTKTTLSTMPACDLESSRFACCKFWRNQAVRITDSTCTRKKNMISTDDKELNIPRRDPHTVAPIWSRIRSWICSVSPYFCYSTVKRSRTVSMNSWNAIPIPKELWYGDWSFPQKFISVLNFEICLVIILWAKLRFLNQM